MPLTQVGNDDLLEGLGQDGLGVQREGHHSRAREPDDESLMQGQYPPRLTAQADSGRRLSAYIMIHAFEAHLSTARGKAHLIMASQRCCAATGSELHVVSEGLFRNPLAPV